MNIATAHPYGELIEPATLKIERLLPGPIERVWSYITDGKLRQMWLASGDMPMKAGSSFELTWRNDNLGVNAGKRPEGFSEEHSMVSEVVEVVPPLKLTITWENTGNVTFELEKHDDKVLLTVTHRRLPTRSSLVMHAAGWHAHLDVLATLDSDEATGAFWSEWLRLRDDYEKRIPA